MLKRSTIHRCVLIFNIICEQECLLCSCDCSDLRCSPRLKAWRYGLHARTASSCSIRSTCGIDLQQHYVFHAAHDLQGEQMHGVMVIEQQDIQHRTTSEPYSSESCGSGPGFPSQHMVSNLLHSLLPCGCLYCTVLYPVYASRGCPLRLPPSKLPKTNMRRVETPGNGT